MRILLVEDEPNIGEAVQQYLARTGHAVDWFTTLEESDDAMRGVAYDLVLLDLQLPDGQGLDLLRAMRGGGSECPVIILTARDQISDRIAGLNAGADDYLVKPFDLDELAARLQAVSRRYAGNPNPMLSIGPLVIDVAGRRIKRDEDNIELTRREWAIMDLLVRRPGVVISKERMEEALYEFGSEIESNTVEVHVSRLRKKLGRDAIQTQRGVGYKVNEA